jgi:hypothetical protein
MEADKLSELAIKEIRRVDDLVRSAMREAASGEEGDRPPPMVVVQRDLSAVLAKLEIIIPIIESRLKPNPPDAVEPSKRPRLQVPEGSR